MQKDLKKYELKKIYEFGMMPFLTVVKLLVVNAIYNNNYYVVGENVTAQVAAGGISLEIR